MNKFTKRLLRKTKYNSKINSMVLFLFALILLFGVGFAYINTTLSVEGVVNVENSSWDIHFENIQVSSGSVEATTQPTIIDDTTVNFGLSLENPGEYYEFTVDVVNDGTYDAKIDSITILPELTDEQQYYFEYNVAYADGTSILVNDALNSGTTETIKIRFDYVVCQDTTSYPDEDIDFNFSVSLDYLQGTGNAVTNSIYWFSDHNEYVFDLGSSVPNGAQVFNNYNNINTLSTYPFFLKHTISGGLISESYVGFIHNNHDYYFRGGVNEKNLTDKPVYEQNKNTLIAAFGSSICNIDSNNCGTSGVLCSYCSINGVRYEAHSDGGITVYDSGDIGCDIHSNGASSCGGDW